jgi:perosamine synthetase
MPPQSPADSPVRETLLPYGRPWVDDDDIAAVAAVLRSDWLTTGPLVPRFEEHFAERVGAREAVAVSNGTAALHATMNALRVGPGDEVIVPAITFAGTANCVVYRGARPVFADVDPDTLLLDPERVEALRTPRTRAMIPVDYAGQPCDYGALGEIARRHGIAIVADACHSLGATLDGVPVGGGNLADMSAFSMHPVKHITAGEGGVITTDDADLAARMRRFRNHGITSDHRERERTGAWEYGLEELGYNYRLTDIQCALADSQLRKLTAWVERRRAIASRYDEAFAELAEVEPLAVRPGAGHAYHLYVIRLRLDRLNVGRAAIFAELRAEGIGVNVHYIPVHMHQFYRTNLGTGPGLCPVAEAEYERILSLPMFPRMSDGDCDDVIAAVRKVCAAHRR